MLTVIIDYDSGNLHSAEKAFQRMAAETHAGDVIVSTKPEDVARADRIVLPGDGAFPACRQQLSDHRGIYEALEQAVIKEGRPFMGICVGMQMLATISHEYQDTDGFDWVKGHVRKIAPEDPALKVPHMGWNDLVIDCAHPVLDGVTTGDHAYFVHSYHFVVDNSDERLAHCDYAGDITAIVGRDNMMGMQFHPEKSQAAGLRMIANFLTWTP
ncbi:glutamine amidotransferase [Aliiroseovarius halocynthiae]|uniref:Imidazole glycerol phosphate synthase subunit HisH n=1 Tax=Aliiroseovarius halocynthiae TaxID=985055 RepID=A0A545SR20_9RHOB|nr:imidazole glycerol phosphate synthase subunit HisH [Aliiroseovarius halocynthiae]TQV67412.1 imidazole glycerol phosphate synthase subunit HisH [Aliiroseovarius halocynthiae]SMR81392.1 glutamine amidotransferase [Aliiroseovarius halocynthiae]